MSFKINNIKRNISKILSFSPDLLTNDMTVTIYEGYQAIISGYKKILIYDDSLLVVSNYKKQLKVIGSKLILSEMSDEELILRGNIYAAEFENNRR